MSTNVHVVADGLDIASQDGSLEHDMTRGVLLNEGSSERLELCQRDPGEMEKNLSRNALESSLSLEALAGERTLFAMNILDLA